MKNVLLIAWLLVSLSYRVFSQTISPTSNVIYVKKDAAGNASGDSWSNAVPELADAMLWANKNKLSGLWSSENPLQIWVAEGTYKPLYSIDESQPPIFNSFIMEKDVQIIGGFAGTETSLAERSDWRAHPSILSGELDEPYEEFPYGPEDTYTAVCHVVMAFGEVGAAVLDGFIITGGKADYYFGFEVDDRYLAGDRGGGIYVQDAYPTLRNLRVEDNRAAYYGAIYLGAVFQETRELLMYNVSVMNNHSDLFGGGIYLHEIRLKAENCRLMGNVAQERGGAIYSSFSRVKLLNTVIAGNALIEAVSYAGGIYLRSSTLEMTNTTMSSNKGGLIYTSDGGTITSVKNSILYNYSVAISGLTESVISNSIVQFITTNNGSNLAGNTNPQFIYGRTENNAPFTDGNYRLRAVSPALDKGDNASYPGTLLTDTDAGGSPRLSGSSIDMGAYEGSYEPLPVALTSFEAHRQEEAVKLIWHTASEIEASYFEVERSLDGKNFKALGTVEARAGEGHGETYNFMDQRPSNGMSYYRLRTVDRDGSFALSSLVSVDGKNSFPGRLYPNPARGRHVILDLGSAGEKAEIRITDLSGRRIHIPVIRQSDGQYTLETQGLVQGLYMVSAYEGERSVFNSRLLIH